MTQLKKMLVVMSALVLILACTTTPVLARDGSDDSGGEQTTTTSTSSGSTETENTSSTTVTTSQSGSNDDATKNEAENKIEVENEVKPEIKDAAQTEIELKGKNLVDNLKKTEKEHTEADRQKNCAAAEKGLETKLSNLSKNASAFQVRVDKVLAMAIAYQSNNSLTIDNFSALVATAQAAQTKSAASISALNALSPNLDCSSPSVAQNIAEFKVATAQARTDLKAYKQDVKAILIAIKTAKVGN